MHQKPTAPKASCRVGQLRKQCSVEFARHTGLPWHNRKHASNVACTLITVNCRASAQWRRRQVQRHGAINELQRMKSSKRRDSHAAPAVSKPPSARSTCACYQSSLDVACVFPTPLLIATARCSTILCVA
eukprot:5066539-Amphidinium_carterae.1